MGRLIDEDDLTEILCGCKCEDCVWKYSECTDYNPAVDNILKILHDIQTAYDVDKVVEQLEELKAKYYSGWNIIDDAIEIVKKGGK